MPSQDDIDRQQTLLATHRRNLALYIQQQSMLGAAYIPPAIANGMREARDNIARIKATLYSWGVAVEDHPDDADQGAPAPAEPVPAISLPYPRNQVFLGRDAELARLAEWLARPQALVAIAGLGGVGKTQLATEFAHQYAGDRSTWPGGVFWVPMSSPASIATAVAG